MQGFGATGAWWPNDLVNFPKWRQDDVGNMLFSQSGIALSVYRYNIGGGGVGVTTPARAPQTFLDTTDTTGRTYIWSRDPGGQLFLNLARHVPVLIGFVNSAPTLWTTNNKNCGGSLQLGSETAFARYLVEVVKHFYEADQITLSYLSPMNEPDYTFADGKQEGMAVPSAQRAALVKAVGQELAGGASYCRVIADESSRVGDQFNREARDWMGVPGTAQYVAYLAHHLYDFPSNFTLQQARQIGQTYGKSLWCTEICCIDSRTGKWGQQYDPTITGGMSLANVIWQCLTQANDAAFHWWVACSPAIGADPSTAGQINTTGWNDGLLYYDPNYASTQNYTIYTTKRYYAMGNFSRYVRPGDRRHDASGGPSNLRILPFSTATGWSVVVINNSGPGSPATSLQLQLPATPWPRLAATGALETSGTHSLQSAPLPVVSSTRVLSAMVPAQSITTYLLSAA